MKLPLYVFWISIAFASVAYSVEPNDREVEFNIAYESCRTALEGSLAYYVSGDADIRKHVQDSIHCQCMKIAAATQKRSPANFVADAGSPSYQDLLNEDESQEQACLPPDPEAAEDSR